MKKRFLCVLACLLFASCQLTTANYLRDKVFPQETGTKLLLSPILFPTYIIACVGDIVIVNPVMGTANVPKVTKSIWKWQNDSPWLGYGALLPVKMVAIPGAAIGTIMFSEQFVYQE